MPFQKKHKFGARRTFCSIGHHHPSALEASVCEILILREKAGDIRNMVSREWGDKLISMLGWKEVRT
jgi:hypothetical protein